MALQITDNEQIAEILEEVAALLELQGANPFRVSAYRYASDELRQMEEQAADLHRDRGEIGLQSIYGVGRRLAGSIAEILETGRLSQLDRLRAKLSPVDLFTQLPGVGETLAERIVDTLDAHSFEELEQAAYQDRLEEVPGIGTKKAEGIAHALIGLISRGARRQARRRVEQGEELRQPPVQLLLALDAEYRQKARLDELPRIAPRRFNPEDEKWLPIMEVQREGWDFTILFSNTRRAHELEMTHEWVVIYADNDEERQYTVVTAYSGALRGKRVVRGREAECRRYYEEQPTGEARPGA